uniref:Killer cell lectin like receptor G1 n=1 Tax=Bos taurus TaxID=9913 RepID=A0AAA9SWY1_BOVIN
MTDNVTYSIIKSSAARQALKDDRQQQEASSSRSPRSYHVAIALGLLSTILASMLLLQWILYRGSKCAGCPHCPDHWMGYGDHCYYFSVEKKSWNSSLEFCLAKDAHLLMFKDSKEMEQVSREPHLLGSPFVAPWVEPTSFLGIAGSKNVPRACGQIELQNLLSQEFYWIGLRNSSGWRWEDGSALNISRIASNSLVQNCGTISKGGLLASSCEVDFPWVCKKVRR